MANRQRKTSNTVAHVVPEGDEGLDALMHALTGAPTDIATAPVETIEPDAGETAHHDEELLEELSEELAFEASVEGATPPATEATVEAAVAAPATETPAPAPTTGKSKKLSAEEKAKRAADREAKRAAAKAEREAKRSTAPKRVYWGKNNVGRMTALMGEDKLRENLILTTSDAAGDLKAVTDAHLAEIKAMGCKVQKRSTYIIEFAHKGVADPSKLNEVIRRAFQVLARDGKIVSGEKGNYAADLLARPYDLGTVRTAGMNSLNAMKGLKIVVPHESEKQTYVLNPESLLGAKVNGLLGLTK